MRAEDELLLQCARTALDSSSAEKIKGLVRGGVQWDYLCDKAIRHGVEPLLFWNLNAACPADVPPSTLARLRDDFLSNAQRNLFLARELLQVLKLLGENDIPVIPYKGPLLAISAYENISLRQISDLDVIVHRRDAIRAKDLLLANGFRLIHSLDPLKESIFLQSNCEFALQNSRIVLDVHWEISPKYFHFPFKLEEVWQRLEPVALAGTPVQTLGAPDLLVILCAHGARHVWQRLDWLCSVSELVRAYPELDWDKVTQLAYDLGGERMLWLGLLLAEQMLGTRLPERVKQVIKADRALEPLALEIRERFYRDWTNDVGVFQDTFVDELHPKMFKRGRHRLRYYFHVIFTPTVSDVDWLRLPGFWSFLYYALRPFRLLVRFGPTLTGRVLTSHG